VVQNPGELKILSFPSCLVLSYSSGSFMDGLSFYQRKMTAERKKIQKDGIFSSLLSSFCLPYFLLFSFACCFVSAAAYAFYNHSQRKERSEEDKLMELSDL